MSARLWAASVATVITAAWTALLGVTASPAAAAPCPDVQVVFARGTNEAPGVGGVGQAFVDAVRAQAAPRTVDVYAVNYPASDNFSGGLEFARTVVDGIRDEANHVQTTAATCPNTRMILGGYSQGAVVSGFVTAAQVPPGVPAELVPAPLPASVADHVAAVVLFGKPSAEFLANYGAPPVVIGPAYAGKTLELCTPGDTICSGAPDGGPTVAHALYGVNGLTNEGAAFAVSRL
ncbi:cutinase family protein [Mycobacterium sp. MYCO198283]|uniref:cutinase family protein n=1 Tax=Mycobacterium sp. MYCO198283 TaxID=2883505 RepID=UPI001E2DACDB|nr:cutinase family protein [Mycobacterium sp. MYCO198283]MCG5430979.1 cutinase family protein [Mycobacterium sp. MYCO198283]